MRFTEARLPGVWRIGLEKRKDIRGFFARVFFEQEFCRTRAYYALSAVQFVVQRQTRHASRHALSASSET